MDQTFGCSLINYLSPSCDVAQRLNSMMSHTIFSLLKIPTMSHKPSRRGAQPRYKHFNKTLLLFNRKSNARYKDKGCMTAVTFIRSIPVLHAENSVPTLFFSGRLYPKKGYQTHDLRFLTYVKLTWICEWAFKTLRHMFTYRGKESPRSCYSLLHQSVQT